MFFVSLWDTEKHLSFLVPIWGKQKTYPLAQIFVSFAIIAERINNGTFVHSASIEDFDYP